MATQFRHLLPVLHRLADEAVPVGLDQVAQDACLSPTRAQRVFSGIVGESPKQYQLRVRLQRAAALLLSSDVRIVDVAIASGFESHEAFTRAFWRVYGLSPSRYRKTLDRWIGPEPVQLAARTAPCIGLYRRPLDQGPPKMEDKKTDRIPAKAAENTNDKRTGKMSKPQQEIERRTVEAVPVLFGHPQARSRQNRRWPWPRCLPAAFGYAMSQGLAMSGPPFVRYIDQTPAFVTVEAGVPLAERADAPPADSGLSTGHLPAGVVAVTVHKGPYEDLGDAHIALDRWMTKNEVTPAGPPWEIYITDPAEVPDPADWLTEVIWPIN